MQSGTVKWYSDEKGFGFITPDLGGDDVFVHRSSLDDLGGSVEDGTKVEFEVQNTPKGLKATSVRRR